jgi:hypothetical protein
MQNWLKRSLLVLGVFGICWIGAVWYWRSTTRMPDTGDLALAMLVMPVTLVTGFWLARKTFAGAPVSPQMPASQEAQLAAPPSSGADAPAAEASWQPLAVAASALRMTHGDSPAELAAAIAEGQARLDLDPELTDSQGFPLMAGRVADVDLAPLEEWLSSQQPAPRAPAGQHQRAMALGGDIAASLAAQAAASGEEGKLQLLPLFPTDWPAATQDLATRWFSHRAADAGWPHERLLLPRPGAAASSSMPTSPLAALRALSAQSAGGAGPALCMLLACDSSIDPDAVEHLSVNGKLYGPRNSNGRMPGEGAAGVLLQPPQGERDAPHLLALHAKEAATLRELAEQALQQANGAQPAYIAADTDHRAAAMSDLMQCVEATAPALDANTSLACIGAACGHTGAVGALAAIALAHEQAVDSGGISLALANNEPTQRFALLVGPLPGPASKAPSLS